MQTYCLDGNGKNTLDSFPLANAYIPVQKFTSPVSLKEALETGTAWSELYMPQKEERQ